MKISGVISEFWKIFLTTAIALMIATLIPVSLGLLLFVPVPEVLVLIASTLLLQANAAFVGVGLGLKPLFILAVMTLVEIGIVITVYGVLDTFAGKSERIRMFMASAEKKMERHVFLRKYGAVTLVILPALPVLDLYSSVIIGWLLHWNRVQSIFFITLGWVLATGFILLVALGIVRLIS